MSPSAPVVPAELESAKKILLLHPRTANKANTNQNVRIRRGRAIVLNLLREALIGGNTSWKHVEFDVTRSKKQDKISKVQASLRPAIPCPVFGWS